MARAELSDSWVVRGTADALLDKLRVFLFTKHKMRLLADKDGEVHAEQGSQVLTRLLGGWFVPATWLPKRVHAEVRETRDGVELGVSMEESLGFGLMDPLLKSKYERFFEQLMADLEDCVR